MKSRNYDAELVDNDRKYAYNFDLDVIHPMMIRTFNPYFDTENEALELGCFKGDFTLKLLSFFRSVVCIEASSEAISVAKKKVNDNVVFINSMFEDAVLEKKYKNIFLTHVLEHIDDRVGLLKKIRHEWLADGGFLFLACPNANAASRQIAVKMGLIEYNAAVTPAEYKHGHRITYSLDTLERDVREAGLEVVESSGIFFKALANYQWDQVIDKGIVSPEYLEACYQLGKKYPDLCSSIYCICRKPGNE